MTFADSLALIRRNPISLCCMAVSIALATGIYMRSEVLPEVEAQLSQKSAEAERISLNVQYSSQLKEQAETVFAANKEIDSRIVRISQVGNNTQYFYKLETDTGVKIMDFRQTTAMAPKSAKGTYVPVAFTVTVQGTLNQILDFVRHLEDGAHYSRMLTASFNGNPSSRDAALSLGLSLELLGLP